MPPFRRQSARGGKAVLGKAALVARFLRGTLWIIALLATVRLVIAGGHAWLTRSQPLEAYHLEGKMVHVAARTMAGALLYPDWRTADVEPNFYAPVYFWIVGRLGRLSGPSVESLFRWGRDLSLLSIVLASAVLAVALSRRCGPAAAVLAAVVSLGAYPAMIFSAVARPDPLADFFGIAGFLLACGGNVVFAAILLALAAFTKQTAIAFALAAVLARAHAAGGRAAAPLALTFAAAMFAGVAVGTKGEPGLASGLLGHFSDPWSLSHWRQIAWRVVVASPDLLAVSLGGLYYWGRPSTRNPDCFWLCLALSLSGWIGVAKLGSDLNYFLGLRLIEGALAADLWRAARNPASRRLAPEAILATLLCLTIAIGTFVALLVFSSNREQIEVLASPRGRRYCATMRHFAEIASDPTRSIMTNSSYIAAFQGERAAFVDPYLFRLMVESGRRSTRDLRERIERGDFETIVLTHPAAESTGGSFALPRELSEAVARHYVLTNAGDGLFVYAPARPAERPGG